MSGHAKELSEEALAAMGFGKRSPEEYAELGRQRDAQMEAMAKRIREAIEARINMGWEQAHAFDAAVHEAADSNKQNEATLQMMVLVCATLARGWRYSEPFVEWWNSLFPGSIRCQGFANPAVVELENGKAAGIITTWSAYMRMTQEQQS